MRRIGGCSTSSSRHYDDDAARLNRDAIIRRLDRMSQVLALLRSLGEPTAQELRDLTVRSQVECASSDWWNLR